MRPTPTGREITFGDDELIVSKTDLRGVITYANDVFVRISGYRADELLGQPHNILRHPDMPASVFRLLWSELAAGREIFAYVNNLARSGDSYWVFAHVTPSRDAGDRVVGYHSNRRVPYADAIAQVRPLYAELIAAERRCASRREGGEVGLRLLQDKLAAAGVTYGEFVFGLSQQTRTEALA